AALYFLVGWLNWDLGIRMVLLGATALLAVSAWTTRNGYETKAGKILVLFTAGFFFGMFAFHAFLHDFFGVQPDDENVMATLFSSDRSEAAEFVEQNAWPLAKHVLIILLAFAPFGWLVWSKPSAKQHPDAPAPKRRGVWKPVLVFSTVFVLLHLSPTLRNQNPLLYFPTRYSSWKLEVESVRKLQARMAVAETDPGLL